MCFCDPYSSTESVRKTSEEGKAAANALLHPHSSPLTLLFTSTHLTGSRKSNHTGSVSSVHTGRLFGGTRLVMAGTSKTSQDSKTVQRGRGVDVCTLDTVFHLSKGKSDDGGIWVLK